MRVSTHLFASIFWSFQSSTQGFLSPLPRSGSDPLASTVPRSSSGEVDFEEKDKSSIRRALFNTAAVASGSLILGTSSKPAVAAVGTLPEFADSDAIIQGITVNVADKSQQDAMIDFLVRSFDFQVLRKRVRDSVEETVRYCFTWS
jgi:hypothetical protein